MTGTRKLDYKVGEMHRPSNSTIAFIVGHSPEVIVFIDGNDKVQWETSSDQLTDVQRFVHQHYDELYDTLVACVPATKHKPVVQALARALFLALSEQDKATALQHFTAARGRVQHEALREGKYRYLTTGTGFTGVVVVVALVAFAFTSGEVAKSLSFGALAGALGAWASLLQRVSHLRLDPFETPAHLRFLAAARIALGMVFGGIATAAIHAGVLVPAAAASAWLQALLQFAAGFSERLVPDLLSRLDSLASKNNSSEQT